MKTVCSFDNVYCLINHYSDNIEMFLPFAIVIGGIVIAAYVATQLNKVN